MSELLLVPIAFLTSALAAVMGMGRGMLLIALMPGLVPAPVILPLHAVTQLASNVSRAAFGWRDIGLGIIPAFLVGAVTGAWLGSEVYQSLEMHWLPALIGLLILLFAWMPLPRIPGGGQLSLLLLVFYQTGLGMIAGATGPVGAADDGASHTVSGLIVRGIRWCCCSPTSHPGGRVGLLAGLLLHLGMIGGSLYVQQYALAVAWLCGVFVYPFFGALRQMLEHRKPDADPTCDYRL